MTLVSSYLRSWDPAFGFSVAFRKTALTPKSTGEIYKKFPSVRKGSPQLLRILRSSHHHRRHHPRLDFLVKGVNATGCYGVAARPHRKHHPAPCQPHKRSPQVHYSSKVTYWLPVSDIKVVLMRVHGLTTIGTAIKKSVFRAIYTQQNASV